MARQDAGRGIRSGPIRRAAAAPPRILTIRGPGRSWPTAEPWPAMRFCVLPIILLMFLYHMTRIAHVQIYVDDVFIPTDEPKEAIFDFGEESAGPLSTSAASMALSAAPSDAVSMPSAVPPPGPRSA